ncbi:MAG: Qat anti-phage system QueC-like protein QatC [Pseudomonadota bacterium]
MPNDIHLRGRTFDARIALFEPNAANAIGSVGTQVATQAIRKLRRSSPPHAWDLTALSMAVIASDRLVNRADTSADGWSRILNVTVAVTAPDVWNGLRPIVERMLRFLTGDIWTIEFVGGGVQPAPASRGMDGRPETCVSLLSGGLDSLIGAIDLQADGIETPLFVSNRVRGDCSKQISFASAVGARSRILTLNHNARTGAAHPEISQRPRSLAFIAFAVLAATALDRYQEGDRVTVYVPENGFISLNVPLTSLRSGSLSTRTTHPIFMSLMQELLDSLGLRVHLENPYGHKTKGEMMAECGDKPLLEQHAPRSMSCGRSGRINRHCGQCLPCLVRRAAFLHHTGRLEGDTTVPPYMKPSPPDAFAQPAYRCYDDVMQCLEAIDTVDRRGPRRWIGASITAGKVPEAEPYRAVAVRGLMEIKSFLHSVGLV